MVLGCVHKPTSDFVLSDSWSVFLIKVWKTKPKSVILRFTKGSGMKQDGLWQAVLGEIELSISRGNFVTWFKNTTLLKQSDGNIVVGVPNIFIKQQLERKYNDLILQTLEKNGVNVQSIEYKIARSTASSSRSAD